MKVHIILILFFISFYSLDSEANKIGGLFGSKIHKAAAKGKLDSVKKLVKKNKENVNKKNKQGKTPLHIASQNGYINLVKYLLEQGANSDSQDKWGNTALHEATNTNQLEVLKHLISNEYSKANVDLTNDAGNTALHFSAWKGYFDITKVLLENGSEVDKQDNSGQTALQLASTWNKLDIVNLLVSKGADLEIKNNEGRTAFSRAVFVGNLGIVARLLEEGANHNVKDKQGKSAFAYALNLSNDVKDKNSIIKLLESKTSSDEVEQAKETQKKIDKEKQLAAKREANPSFCEERDNPALNKNDNKALRYLIRKQFGSNGLGSKERLCIEYIHIKDSIIIRGEKLITYTAELMFPKGHKTHCLDKRATQGANWVNNSDCIFGTGVKPQKPGARGVWDGESTI